MSFDALAWAGKCAPGSASRKLVLFGLADRHNDEVDGAYPSIAWLADFTSLNRKTIINALAELEAAGFISDSGERRGDTKQIKVYRLHIGTVPKAEQSQKRNSSENASKQSQKRDTDTVRTTTPQKATPSSGSRASKGSAVPSDFWPSVKPISITGKAMAAWPPGEIEEQVEHFIDRNTACGALSKDWQASWRTWVKHWKKFNGQRPANDRSQPSNPMYRASLGLS